MNQVKTRLQALGLLDRSFGAATDDEIDAALAALDDEHRDAMTQLLGGTPSDEPSTTAGLRDTIAHGRLDGTIESVALVLTDACLADCIEQLGDHSEHPSSDELREVLPGLIERHGVAITRIMLASTVVGEAPASAIIRDLLKHDDTIKLPPTEPKPLSPILVPPAVPAGERAALKAKRKELKDRKQAAARASREQSARDRHRI